MALGTDPIAQFNRVDMIDYVESRPSVPNFLQYLLMKGENEHDTELLQIDLLQGNREISVYVSRDADPTQVGKRGYTSVLHEAPYIYDQLTLTPKDFKKREPGMTQYQSSTAAMGKKVVKWVDELDGRVMGRIELQLAEALRAGTVTVTGDGVSYTVDFGQLATHLIELSGTARWTEASTRNINQNLIDWCQLPIIQGGRRPNIALMDVAAMQLLKSDTTVLANLDNRRVETGTFRPEIMDQFNATREGWLSGTGYNLELFTYQGTYTINGTAGSFMDSHRVILLNNETPVTTEWGRIENFKADNFSGKKFINEWGTEDGKNKYVSIEASPLAFMHKIKEVVSVHVTSAS